MAQWAEASCDFDPYDYSGDWEDLTVVYQTRSQDPGCVHCRGSHELDRCSTFPKLGLDKRREAILKANLCLSCLRRGHWVFTCPSKKACGTDGCVKIHHPLIHPAPKATQKSKGPKGPQDDKGKDKQKANKQKD